MSAGTPTADRPPERAAIGLSQDAEAYRLAALRVQPRDAPASEVNLVLPAWFLLCHSSELALKAFLLSHGTPPGSRPGGLKHPSLRHNLKALFEKALQLGLRPPDEEFGDLMDWLSPYHEDHVFRYPEPGRIRLASVWFMAEILEPVIADVQRTVRQRWQEREGRA